MVNGLTHQGIFDFAPGSIGGVQNASMAVSAFARQMITLFSVCLHLSIKQHALIDKPLHAVFSVAGDKRYGLTVANSGAGNQRVINVRFNAVRFIENGGDSALRIEG